MAGGRNDFKRKVQRRNQERVAIVNGVDATGKRCQFGSIKGNLFREFSEPGTVIVVMMCHKSCDWMDTVSLKPR